MICINLVNFTLFENISKYHSCFLLTEKDDTDKILTDHLQIHFVELPKNKSEQLDRRLQKWVEYFKNVHTRYEQFTADDKLRDLYDARLKRQRDESTLLESAKADGIEEGIKKGMHTKAIDTAKALRKEKMTVEKIAGITGLSISEIENLNE